MKNKVLVCAALVVVVALGAFMFLKKSGTLPGDSGTAAGWPQSKTVQIYVPFAAGGNSDLCARIFAKTLSKKTGSNFVVVNQTEGNGAVCYNTIAAAPKDGSSIGWVTPSWFTSYFAGSHDLKPTEKFSTIAVTTAMTSQYLIVPKNSPFNTVKDLVDHCKANPGKLLFGMQLGSASHYYAENARQNLDVKWNYVETGSGDAKRITAIMGNIIEATTVNVVSAQQYLEAGEIKVLAALYAPQSAPESLKNVPTLKQAGFEDITVKNCNFLYTAKLDDKVCEAMYKVFADTFNDPDVQKQLKEMNQEQILCASRADSVQAVADLYNSYRNIASALGILAPGM
ncbi:MAG: tripartite tricarboxylate transporter substrate binding protein [Pyramidobacter sp.]|nr:tripartite tricarboxylate transporter substrate binding protein [Pyramidobacter sp.]